MLATKERRSVRQYTVEEFERSDADVEILGEEDILTGDDVLPGFNLSVREAFADALAE
jgi:Uma2 family endonuclease